MTVDAPEFVGVVNAEAAVANATVTGPSVSA